MHRITKITCLIAFIALSINVKAQPASSQDVVLPKVFILGEYERVYEDMVLECNSHLLSVCENSMDDAYNLWLTMLSEIEIYAKEQNFEINGLKMWITAYWNSDGTLKHLVYHPKPSSRNMDFEELSEFLDEFTKVYTLPKTHNKCFSHYGSASFPTFAKMYITRGK